MSKIFVARTSKIDNSRKENSGRTRERNLWKAGDRIREKEKGRGVKTNEN